MWAIKDRPSVEFWASERCSISSHIASPCKQTLWGGGDWDRKFFLRTPPPTLTSLPQATHSNTYILFACFRFPHSNLDSKVRHGGQPEGTTWVWFACSINKTFSGLINKFGLTSIQSWASGFSYKNICQAEKRWGDQGWSHDAYSTRSPPNMTKVGGGVESHRQPCVGLMFDLILAPRGFYLVE